MEDPGNCPSSIASWQWLTLLVEDGLYRSLWGSGFVRLHLLEVFREIFFFAGFSLNSVKIII